MQSHERYHAFDALRAAMMILGVFLHSATAYSTFRDVWWLKDPQTTRWADYVILFIHSFRLPVFFVMTGFFGALLWEKRGALKFVENRMMRLGLPMLLGMAAMYPALKTASVYCYFWARDPQPWARTLGWLGEGRLERGLEPMHLWFLEVLLWTCLSAVVAAPWLDRLRGLWFSSLMAWWGAPLVFALPTFLTLLPSELGILDTPHNFFPQFRIQAAYAVFFAAGWGIYRNREALDGMRNRGWGHVAVAAGLTVIAGGAIERQLALAPQRDWLAFLTTSLLTALMAWMMIFGLTGVFLRYAAQPSARFRYLSDSAYWLYLVHPPVLVMLQVPMMHLRLAPELKTVIGFVLAMPILLWTYEVWVRSTWVGVVLNGRKYGRLGGGKEESGVLGPCANETEGHVRAGREIVPALLPDGQES